MDIGRNDYKRRLNLKKKTEKKKIKRKKNYAIHGTRG